MIAVGVGRQRDERSFRLAEERKEFGFCDPVARFVAKQELGGGIICQLSYCPKGKIPGGVFEIA